MPEPHDRRSPGSANRTSGDRPHLDGERLPHAETAEPRQPKPDVKRVLRFLADAHLGALARDLRMLGFDTRWYNDLGDAALLRLAATEARILLSRDRALLRSAGAVSSCFVPQGSKDAQLHSVVQRWRLCGHIAPFSRCTRCNRLLRTTTEAEARTALPQGLRGRELALWHCGGCGRLYWKGSHWRAMRRRILSVCPAAHPALPEDTTL